MSAVFRAVIGYTFLVFMVRIAGRRPGKQMTPFEFVLVFFRGGLTLTTLVGKDRSVTNAFCAIITVALTHYFFAWLRQKSQAVSRIMDGTPLVLLSKGQLHTKVLKQMFIADDDIMAAARDKGVKTLDDIEYAFLERNGEISIVSAEGGS